MPAVRRSRYGEPLQLSTCPLESNGGEWETLSGGFKCKKCQIKSRCHDILLNMRFNLHCTWYASAATTRRRITYLCHVQKPFWISHVLKARNSFLKCMQVCCRRKPSLIDMLLIMPTQFFVLQAKTIGTVVVSSSTLLHIATNGRLRC